MHRLLRYLRRPAAAQPQRELVLIDARNVQRSGWPNPTDAQLVAALGEWAVEREWDADVVLVVDGQLQDVEPQQAVDVVEVGYADDELVERAQAAVAAGRAVRVATSDRELRDRLTDVGAQIAWGGGRLLRDLGLTSRGR